MADEINYICKRTVVSTKPAPLGNFHAISPLGRRMEKYRFCLLYYFGTPIQMPGETTKILRDALSAVLSEYPVMLGRLVKDREGKWVVKCNDAGLRVVEARVPTTMENWLERLSREKELKLLHWEDMVPKPYFWSTFYIQLTEFNQGGVAIGLSCCQMIADITTAAAFVKSWADTASSQIMVVPPQFTSIPSFSRVDHTNNQLIQLYSEMIKSTSVAKEAKYATMGWRFADDSVGLVRKEARVDAMTDSAFQILSALFWVCINRCKGGQELLSMSIRKDARDVLGLQVGFFGNVMVQCKVEPSSEGTLASACERIGVACKNVSKDAVMGLVEWLDENDGQAPCQMNGCDLICESAESVNPYESVFGCTWVPLRFNCFTEPMACAGHVLILPSLSEDGPQGRVVIVTLLEDYATKLLDEEMLQRFSTLMFKY